MKQPAPLTTGDHPFLGNLDNIRVYSRVWSANEMALYPGPNEWRIVNLPVGICHHLAKSRTSSGIDEREKHHFARLAIASAVSNTKSMFNDNQRR